MDAPVRSQDVPALREVLGLAPTDDLLDTVAARFSGPAARELRSLIQQSEVPCEIWSRVGD